VTMLALVIVSNIVGIALPFLLTRFGLDPAVASSPLITTIVDAAGLLIYFSVATLILV
jgi:magnesium transporter